MLGLKILIIVLLGVFISFYLFAEGERLNLQTTSFGEVIQNCPNDRNDYENCLTSRNRSITQVYGAPYWELKKQQEEQMTFLIIPAVMLFAILFVVFAARKNEVLLSVAAVIPLCLCLSVYHPFATKLGMATFYIALTMSAAWFISRLKLIVFFRN